jgi:polar amino acid transport system permease protein
MASARSKSSAGYARCWTSGKRTVISSPSTGASPSGGRRLADVAQLALLIAAVAWLVLHGAGGLGYNWQWYRIPPYLVRIVDGTVIWGPLLRGLGVTLEISAAVLGIGRFWTGILCLAVFEGSFAAEIFRAGISSVPKGQWEASDSLGLGSYARFRRVILPQAVQLMLPPLTGQAVSLIKDSSIVSVIAIFDLTNEGRTIISDTFMSFEVWFTVAAIYLVLTVSLSAVASRFEHRVARYRRS